jgi:hypothetical protein
LDADHILRDSPILALFQSLSGESGWIKVGRRFTDRIEHERRVEVMQSVPYELVEPVGPKSKQEGVHLHDATREFPVPTAWHRQPSAKSKILGSEREARLRKIGPARLSPSAWPRRAVSCVK